MSYSTVCSETYAQLAAEIIDVQPETQEQIETEQTEEIPPELESFDFESLEPDFNMAANFLSRFGSQITFQIFKDRDDCTTFPRHFHGTFANLIHSLKIENRAKSGIFFMVNEGDGRGRSAPNVIRTRAIYADLDGSPIAPVYACKLQPHIVVESSPGRYHAYWFCVDVPLAKFRGLQKSLIHRFKSDDKVHDLPRVMRLPGFYHLKGEPAMSVVLAENHHAPFTYDELNAEFPLAVPMPKKAKSSGSKKQTVSKQKYGDGERTTKLITEIGKWLQQGNLQGHISTINYLSLGISRGAASTHFIQFRNYTISLKGISTKCHANQHLKI